MPKRGEQCEPAQDVENSPDHRWAFAIKEWQSKRPKVLVAELNNLHVPEFVREFLCDLALKKVAPLTNSRPRKRTHADERTLAREVYAEWDRLKELKVKSPRDQAIASVAENKKMSEDALRGIMEAFRDAGVTKAVWRSYLKPASK